MPGSVHFARYIRRLSGGGTLASKKQAFVLDERLWSLSSKRSSNDVLIVIPMKIDVGEYEGFVRATARLKPSVQRTLVCGKMYG